MTEVGEVLGVSAGEECEGLGVGFDVGSVLGSVLLLVRWPVMLKRLHFAHPLSLSAPTYTYSPEEEEEEEEEEVDDDAAAWAVVERRSSLRRSVPHSSSVKDTWLGPRSMLMVYLSYKRQTSKMETVWE